MEFRLRLLGFMEFFAKNIYLIFIYLFIIIIIIIIII